MPLPIEDKAHNAGEDEGITTIDVDGTPVKLDKLGPIIINSDGTVSRITNWHEMGEIERNRTVRLLVKKRNLERLRQLDQEEKEGGSGTNEEKLSALQSS